MSIAFPDAQTAPAERVSAAVSEFYAWQPPQDLSLLVQQVRRADRNGTALSTLVSELQAMLRTGLLTPEKVSEAIEHALRDADGGVRW